MIKRNFKKIGLGLMALIFPAIASAVEITNPLQYESLTELLDGILDFLFAISAPIITIMVLYAAFLFMTSAGESAKVEKARKTLLYIVIGVAVLLLSKAMVSFINSFIG